MFINSKKSFRFAEGENELKIPAGYVGDFPDWATKTYLYQLAVKGGDIVTVGETKATVTVDPVIATDVGAVTADPAVADAAVDPAADGGADSKAKGKA
jgi:hypothetical protein